MENTVLLQIKDEKDKVKSLNVMRNLAWKSKKGYIKLKDMNELHIHSTIKFLKLNEKLVFNQIPAKKWIMIFQSELLYRKQMFNDLLLNKFPKFKFDLFTILKKQTN